MFKYLSPAEFDALSEYQKEKYMADKTAFETKQAADAAKAAGKEAADAAVEAVKAEFTAIVDAQKEEIAAIKLGASESEKKTEAALAEMNRIKVTERDRSTKTMQTEIYEALTKEGSEGRKQLENFAQNKKLAFEITGKNVLKSPATMGVTAGTVPSDWLMPIGIPHETVQGRDIIPVFPTTREIIKYVQFTKKDGSIGTVAPGATKPQFDYNSTPKSANVVKIAGWVSTQEEFLDDVPGAAEWLATELPWAYKDEETRQIFKGVADDVDPEELSGLFSKQATAVNYSGTVTANSNRWDKIAMALTNSRRSLRPGDACWISPEDYMELLINKSSGYTQEYDYPIQAGIGGQLYIGGIPIYFHTVFAADEGLTGNFSRGVALFQRKAITLRTSTEHDQNFVKNLVTFLIEARVAMPCFFPESFKKIDFTITT